MCDKPSVLYSQKLVRGVRRTHLLNSLVDIEYTCGASFVDLENLAENHVLKSVFVRKKLT